MPVIVSRYCSRKPSQTGYMTQSLLCLPITIQGATIGVLQLVNKVGGGGGGGWDGGGASFTAEDEARVRSFSVYCGLALHHAKLLDKIRRSEQKLKVKEEKISQTQKKPLLLGPSPGRMGLLPISHLRHYTMLNGRL